MGGMDADMMAAMPPNCMEGMGPDMMAMMPPDADAMGGQKFRDMDNPNAMGWYGSDMMAAMPPDAMGGMDADMMAAIDAHPRCHGRYGCRYDGRNAT